jgi:hypothetical protein
MTVKTIADVSPAGVATPLVVASPNVPVYARWIQIGCSGTGGRAGDSNIGNSRGSIVPPTNTLPLQIGYMIQEGQGLYDLTQIYVFHASATFSVTFGI